MTPWIPDEDYAALLERIGALEGKKLKLADLPWDEIIQKLSTEASFKGRDLLLKKSVGTDLLAADSVTEDQLAPDSVGSSEISADAVGTDERAVVPYCHVTNSANQSIADVTETTLTFDTEVSDVGGMHSTSSNTGRITFTVPGVYLLVAQVGFATAAGGRRFVRIRIDGTTVIAGVEEANDSDSFPTIIVPTLYRVAAAQYAEVRVYQDSGGALNSLKQADFTPEFKAIWLSK